MRAARRATPGSRDARPPAARPRLDDAAAGAARGSGGRQSSAAVYHQQVGRAEVLADLVEAGVADGEAGAVQHHQADMVATDPAELRRPRCPQLGGELLRRDIKHWRAPRNSATRPPPVPPPPHRRPPRARKPTAPPSP